MQALRDLYLVHRTIDFSSAPDHDLTFLESLKSYFKRTGELFTDPRLRNSTISACTVNLGQQLCGINIFAFYSSTLFLSVVGDVNYTGDVDKNRPLWRTAMLYSFGFGMSPLLSRKQLIKETPLMQNDAQGLSISYLAYQPSAQ